MASHLFACHETKERGTVANTEEQRKGMFHVIKPMKTKNWMYIQVVPQGERCASIIKTDRWIQYKEVRGFLLWNWGITGSRGARVLPLRTTVSKGRNIVG